MTHQQQNLKFRQAWIQKNGDNQNEKRAYITAPKVNFLHKIYLVNANEPAQNYVLCWKKNFSHLLKKSLAAIFIYLCNVSYNFLFSIFTDCTNDKVFH